MTECTKVYGKSRVYYIHTPACRAARRLGKRLGRQPTLAEIRAELRRTRKPSASAHR